MNENTVYLSGRVGVDPKAIKLENGMDVIELSIAQNRKDKNDYEYTDWYSVVCFENLAKRVASHIKKGTLVNLKGKLQTSSFKTKDQRNVKKINIIAKEIYEFKPLI